MSKTESYTFPFNTCEIPNETGIAQSYSAFLNLISCFIIIYFLSKTKTIHLNYCYFRSYYLRYFILFHIASI